jgi:hypothetical protein
MLPFQILELFYKISEIHICKRGSYKSCNFRYDRVQINFSRADSCVKMWRFSDVSPLNPSPSSACAGCLVEPEPFLVLPSTEHTVRMKTELVAETSKAFTCWRGCLPEKISFKRGICCGEAVRKISAACMTHHWLRTGWSGDRIPVGARFSAPVQTGPRAHPASCTMGTDSFPGVKSGRGVRLTPHLLLVSWSWKGRAIPLLPLRAVRPVQSLSALQGCALPYMTHYSVRFKWQRKLNDRSNVLSRHDAVNALDNLQLDLQNKDLLIRASSIPSGVLCTKTLWHNSRSYVIFHGF